MNRIFTSVSANITLLELRDPTVIDERSGPKPKLGAVLACGVHDTEVILAVAQQHVLLTL